MLFNTVPYGMACNAIHNVEERKPLNIRIVRVKYVTTKLFELPFIRTRDVLSRLHIYIKNILTLNFTLHLFQRKYLHLFLILSFFQEFATDFPTIFVI